MIQTKSLGANCPRCLCSICRRRKTCKPHEWTVDEYCDNECRGKVKMIEKCDNYERRFVE